MLPAAFRPRTLVVLTEMSSRDRARLSPSERTRLALLYEAASARWERAGYRTMVVGGDFAPEDYFDLNHFTDKGGAKLARAVAAPVRELAGDATGAAR